MNWFFLLSKFLKNFCALRFSQVPFGHSARTSQAAVGSPARITHSRRSRVAHLREWLSASRAHKINSKNEFLTNENAKLNHERVEDKEPTSLSLTARRMDARNSRNLTPNFEGKRGVFELK
jgi:hypothetical protein